MPEGTALPTECDVLVAGSGAAGMAAALAAAAAGCNVLLVEATSCIGGSTALSGGVVWIPGNALPEGSAREAELRGARDYIAAEAGNRFDAPRTESFLLAGPDMVQFMESETALRFQRPQFWPDYHAALPGSTEGGRSMRASTFDGRRLGRDLPLLREALPETLLFGGMMVGGDDLPRLAGALRSWSNFGHAARLLARYLTDRVRYRRATRLTNGAALAAALAKSLFDRGIRPRTQVQLADLQSSEQGISGAELRTADGARHHVDVRRGVILAGGGMAASNALRAGLYSGQAAMPWHVSLAPPGNQGTTLTAALDVGAALDRSPMHSAAWVPVSRVPRADGGEGWFPHFFDRSKPGFIMVDKAGRRFANEAMSYHDLGAAMQALGDGVGPAEAFILCDHRAIKRYGLGMVRPAPLPLGPHLRSGYLTAAHDLETLAQRSDIDPVALAATLANYNAAAQVGIDPEFGKGKTAYERYIGDPGHQPNPCVAPLERPPFYAVRVTLGDIGSFVGLRTDGQGRVLDTQGQPIAGLYAAGNDAGSLFGGSYPAAGITLGPALTFGFLAGRHCAGRGG